MSERISFVCVDLQNDFASANGALFAPRPSLSFIQDIFFPFLKDHEILVSEIISDYRQPRPGDERDCCHPGQWGYLSLLPPEIRSGRQWIKSMNSPVWTRAGIGDPNTDPGEPYPDPENFGKWLDEQIGPRREADKVIFFGLTADCCVLSAVQELRWRGYDVSVLAEATDVRSGDKEEKNRFLSSPPFTYWGREIRWDQLKAML